MTSLSLSSFLTNQEGTVTVTACAPYDHTCCPTCLPAWGRVGEGCMYVQVPTDNNYALPRDYDINYGHTECSK